MRLIDADALVDAMEKTGWYHINEQGKLQCGANSELHTALYKAEDVYAVMENAPTIDAMPVVRCKDCKYRDRYYCFRPEQKYLAVDIDYYCARGERRES